MNHRFILLRHSLNIFMSSPAFVGSY